MIRETTEESGIGYKSILSKKRVSFVKIIGIQKKASLKTSLQILFLSTCLLWGYSAQASDILIVTESLPPYSYQDGDAVKGMSTEVVQAVLHEVGIQADIHVYSWTRAYLLALTKPNVLIYSISRTPEREELFQWIGEVAPQGSYLFKLASRRDIQLNTLDDAKAYRVGTWRDDVSEHYLIGKGFVRGKHLDNSGTPKQNILKLIKQRLDLTSDAELSFYHQARELGHDPALFVKAFRLEDLSQPLYMAFNRETPMVLVNAFRKALASIKRQGLYEAIHRKYPSLSTRQTD